LVTRLELARKVYTATSRYDGLITMELERFSAAAGRVELGAKPLLPERVHIALRRQQELRYGENPHQAAALYVPAAARWKDSPRRGSSRARNFPTTILSISKRRAAWPENFADPRP